MFRAFVDLQLPIAEKTENNTNGRLRLMSVRVRENRLTKAAIGLSSNWINSLLDIEHV